MGVRWDKERETKERAKERINERTDTFRIIPVVGHCNDDVDVQPRMALFCHLALPLNSSLACMCENMASSK